MKETTVKNNTPKDVFLHLLNILAFYLSVIGFINLYIQYVSILFPDLLNFYYTGIANSVRVFSSILVIALPVYILTAWLLGKDLRSNHQKREMRLRKWLLYFTLFVSAVTIIVDLIMFVYSFLSGELTVRFFLKIFVVLVVAAAVFGYYIWDLRRKDKEKSKTPKKLAWAASLIVAASIVLGFFIVGTPAEQRDMRFDDQRTSDLQVIQGQVVSYWISKGKLPQTLDALKDSISGFTAPQDPETKNPYEYRIIGSLTFELCADFKTVSQKTASAPVPFYRGEFFQQNWEHKNSRTCFERTIDPELYKQEQKGGGVIVPAPAY